MMRVRELGVLCLAALGLSAGAWADEPPDSAANHVPPEPPQHVMADMPYDQMTSMMQMDDTRPVGKVLIDRLEWRDAGEGLWDIQGWYGGDYNKLWFKTEGEHSDGATRDARAELLWNRVISRWWNAQAGVRQDFGQGPGRTWLALGLEGLAPYWMEAEATFYVGEQGRTALRLEAEYDLLITQRWILQPHGELNVYGKADPQRLIGSGLSNMDLGLRLRYEIRREFAPYLGVAWSHYFGDTADLVRAAGEGSGGFQFVAGLRMWF